MTMFVDHKSLSGRHIMLVEDDYFVATCIQDCLRAHGATVAGPWPNVSRAMASLDEQGHRIDAAVLDIELCDGERSYPIAKRLDWVGIPYLFSSALSLSQITSEYQECLNVGKPALDRRLVGSLSRLLSSNLEKKQLRAVTRLEAVSRHIRASERRVAQQQEQVALLRDKGRDLSLAEGLLHELVNGLSALEQTHAGFLEELRLIRAGAL